MKHTIVAMIEIETNDPRLDPAQISVSTARDAAALRRAVLANLQISVSTARDAAALRRAVLANLQRLTRVVAVMPVEHARALMVLHEAMGDQLLGEQMADRPPPDYVPPTRD